MLSIYASIAAVALTFIRWIALSRMAPVSLIPALRYNDHSFSSSRRGLDSDVLGPNLTRHVRWWDARPAD